MVRIPADLRSATAWKTAVPGPVRPGSAQEVARLIDQVTRLLRRAFDERARKLGVTRVQWQVPMTLSRQEGIGQASLADMFEVEPISISRLVSRLEASGLIVRHDNPSDRRAHCLYLSDKAKAVLEKLAPLAQQCIDEALAGMQAQDVAMLCQTLKLARANLQAERHQDPTPRAVRTATASGR
jgi:DNA-binding MarR family transcriptional regulator